MKTAKSGDFRQSLVDKFGENNGKIAYFLLQEQSRLINDWRTFLYLFCGDKRRIELVKNASEVFFFGVVQQALWDVTILRLRRLTDKNVTGTGDQNKNVGLCRLLDLTNDDNLVKQTRLIQEALVACSSVKKDVDKALAHNDLTSLLKETRFQTFRRDVTTAVEKVSYSISFWFHDGDELVAKDMFPITTTKDEQAMLAKLFVGELKYEEVRRDEAMQDLKNGPQVEPTMIVPDWIWDDSLRDNPFKAKKIDE